LILRGIAFEFRSKDENPRWRSLWDWCAFFGSLLPALLWGVAFANFIRGVPIDAELQYAGGFWNLLNPFALLGGLVSLVGLILYGSVFLTLKTSGDLMENARKTARRVWPVALIIMIAFTIAGLATKAISGGAMPVIVVIAAVVALLVSGWFIYKQREGWAFSFLALTVIFSMTAIFLSLFPNVMISLGNPANNLTIYNVSSSPATLKLMTIIALIFVPIVLAYQGWSYWIFRKRITDKPEDIQALKY